MRKRKMNRNWKYGEIGRESRKEEMEKEWKFWRGREREMRCRKVVTEERWRRGEEDRPVAGGGDVMQGNGGMNRLEITDGEKT